MSKLASGAVWLALAVAPVYAQNGSVHRTPPREVRAVRVSSEIHVDGRLDEAAWQTASPATDFLQSQPRDGEPATQRTEVRFLFDGSDLYIGARMFDSLGAEGVRTRLVRRDGSADADKLTVVFDTYHDHLGMTEFGVNPSGVRWDASGLGGSSPDDSWDPVWEVETRIDSLGWTAEMRIPLAQLRYPTAREQTWGLQIVRLESRLNEQSNWAWWPLDQAGGPERYGHLTGLDIDRKPGRLEVLPYVVGRSANVPVADTANPFADPHRLGSRVGGDLKFLLTSNLTLTATVNPDFGQVEVDPAVVNLSAFETFFEERRPFFVEGSGYFRFGGLSCNFCSNVSGLSLFYPRRIGRQPQGGVLAEAAGSYAKVPENSTILGAAKITGRTPSGWSLGVMDAMTRREFAAVQLQDSTRGRVQVEPFTNYFVGRLAKDLRGGATVVSGMATSVMRDLSDPGLAGLLTDHAEGLGFEQVSYFGQREYTWRTTVAFSQISGEPASLLRAQRSSARYFQRPDRESGANGLFTDRYDSTLTAMRGWALYSRFAKQSGDFMFETSVNARSPGFEVNDIAFLSRADYVWMNANVLWHLVKPTPWYRRLLFIAGGQQQYNFDGDLTDRQVQAYGYIQPPNYWEINSFVIHRPRVFDDRATRGGPVVQRAGLTYVEVDVSTDARKQLVLETTTNRYCTEESACGVGLNLSARLRPVSNISLSLGPGYTYDESRSQYVTAADDPTATRFYGRRYVFADLVQRELSLNTRINVTFTPGLTLEVFAQTLFSSGKYSNYKEFVTPRGLEKRVFTDVSLADGVVTVDPDGATGAAAPIRFDQPDFTFRSLRGNAVLRWEYKPGSTLYFVWTQSRANSQALGDLAFGRDIGRLFDAPAENLFLIKASYWLGW